ncbi:Cytochrome P450 [Macleaya cordata]|uniref:Cytochrome P450 n=1 Tax=Macleaya cordata TaxID=56857 RepID=A0A200QNJ2_MACCD|nr:Cytochrome P450 [Macleaya cordata]
MMLKMIMDMDIWDSVVLFLVALAVISFTHFWYRWSHPKCNGGKLPPGSMGFPLIGESLQFFIPTRSLDMPHFVKKRIAKYGKVFRTSLAGRPIIVSSDPEFSYYIFQQEGKLVNLWYMDSFSSILGEAPSATATAYIHKYIRNVVLNHFGTETLKETLMSKMEVMANQSLATWSTQPSVELKQSLASMIFDLTSKQLFNYESSKSSANMSQMFTDFLQGLMSFPINIPGTAYHKCLKNQQTALNLMRGILHERLKSPEKRYGDFLDQIVEDMKTEEFLKEDFVLFFMFGLLLASFETISATLTVGMTLLSEHPEVVKQLKEEHEELLRNREKADSQLTWQEFKSLTFTPLVVSEILRMSSVAPGILRKVVKDIHMNAGYVIPEGWTIMVVPSALQMNPEKYKDPLDFNPWRWNDLGSNVAKSFIPFGGGSRNCAGAEFSKVLISVFLHVMVTKYSWKKLKGGKPGRTPALSFGTGGLHVKITRKSEINAAI